MLLRCPGKEPLSRSYITPSAQEEVDRAAFFVHGPVQVDPLAAHLDIRLIHTPGVADWPRGSVIPGVTAVQRPFQAFAPQPEQQRLTNVYLLGDNRRDRQRDNIDSCTGRYAWIHTTHDHTRG